MLIKLFLIACVDYRSIRVVDRDQPDRKRTFPRVLLIRTAARRSTRDGVRMLGRDRQQGHGYSAQAQTHRLSLGELDSRQCARSRAANRPLECTLPFLLINTIFRLVEQTNKK